MAYPNVYHVRDTTTEVAERYIAGDNDWAYEPIANKYDLTVGEILNDEVFVDAEGELYAVSIETAEQNCTAHETLSGKCQIHLKDDEGGCSIEIYEAEMCTECKSVWLEELVYTTKYDECEH